MKKHIETLIELVSALSQPKASIVSVAATGLASVPTIGRWQRQSRADPEAFTFAVGDDVLPLHEHMRKAAQTARARYAAGERAPSRRLRHRVTPVEVEVDPTADAPQAPGCPVDGEHKSDDVVAASHRRHDPAPVESALTKDLRERIEARKSGTPLPPIVPVRGAAPSPRYVSPEEKSEGIGAGRVREGGFKVQ